MRDPTTAAVEWRDGHVWCLLHETWWKLCSCPGQVSTTVPITKEMFEAVMPNPNAYLPHFLRGMQ